MTPASEHAGDRATAQRLAAASDERRRHVERVLHDGVQQHMALLGLKLSMLQKRIVDQPDEAVAMCNDLREEIQGTLRELRTVAHLIYPAILENEGIAAALRNAVDRFDVHTEIDVADGVHLPSEIGTAFYFCCIEALDNVAKHAGPGAAVTVRVWLDDGAAHFEVTDDGAGFEVDDSVVRPGLQHMADRVDALNGTFELSSAAGGGTRVRGAVPLPAH